MNNSIIHNIILNITPNQYSKSIIPNPDTYVLSQSTLLKLI